MALNLRPGNDSGTAPGTLPGTAADGHPSGGPQGAWANSGSHAPGPDVTSPYPDQYPGAAQTTGSDSAHPGWQPAFDPNRQPAPPGLWQQLSQTPLFPRAIVENATRQATIALSLIFLVLALGTVFSLFSYDPLDPSINTASDRTAISNWLGRSGATLADSLLQFAGYAAWLLPFIFLIWAIQCLRHGLTISFLWRALLLPLLLLSAAAVLTVLSLDTGWSKPVDGGGAGGQIMIMNAERVLRFPPWLTATVCLVIALLCFGYCSAISAARWRLTGATIVAGIATGFAAIAALLSRSRVQQAEGDVRHPGHMPPPATFTEPDFAAAEPSYPHPDDTGTPYGDTRTAPDRDVHGQHQVDLQGHAPTDPRYAEPPHTEHQYTAPHGHRPQPPEQPQLSPEWAHPEPAGSWQSYEVREEPSATIAWPAFEPDRLTTSTTEVPAENTGEFTRFSAEAAPQVQPETAPPDRHSSPPADDPFTLGEPEIDDSADDDDLTDDAPLIWPPQTREAVPAAEPAVPVPQASPQPAVREPAPEPAPAAAPLPSKAPAKPKRPKAKAYKSPPMNHLTAADLLTAEPGQSRESLKANAELLTSVLKDFGVKGEITNMRAGPVVTLYELQPAPGTKTSRVVNLADDIARSMSALSARIAVVPGRNVIGIELPNPTRETVYLREIFEHKSYKKTAGKLPLALGKDIGGGAVTVDLAKMPHLLIAGTTGSGKSVGVNTMILSLLYKLGPERCKFIMIDPKMLELSVYDGIPHLLSPVVTDPKKAVVALNWAVREMEERYKAMSQMGVRNIEGYNNRLEQARASGEVLMRKVQTGFDVETGKPTFEEQEVDLTPLPFIVIIVDEMADLMLVAGKDIESALQRLAQMARAAGIHLVMATQRPSVDVITGTIKANFPTRISFAVTSKIDSRTILGEMGAEQLLGQGDMLYMPNGGRIVRVHGPFASDDEVEAIVRYLRDTGEPSYIEDITAEPEAPDVDGEAMTPESSGDALYDQAVAIVLREKKASTSFVQRHLQIGYNRAARLIERMEAEGLISAADRVGRRNILVGTNMDGSDNSI